MNEENVKKEYRYGMRLRGFSPGCQPMKGLVERVDDPTGKYHDVLIYDRELTEQEVRDYELDRLFTGQSKKKTQSARQKRNFPDMSGNA